MKKIISIILIIYLISSYTYADNELLDIKGHWAEKEINIFMQNEYVNGYEDDTFKPDNNIKINEFIKILVGTIDNSIAEDGDKWSDSYINFAKQKGIILSNNYNEEELLTRGYAIELIYNYINFYDENFQYNEEGISKFLDIKDLDNKYIGVIFAGIIRGYEDNTIRVNNYITRAECIMVLGRLIEYRDNIIMNKIYDITNKDNQYLSNIKSDEDLLVFYIINNNEIYYNDNEKYANYLNVKSIKSNEIIECINKLINKGNYVFVTYLSDIEATYIAYGTKKEYIDNGQILFDIYIYDNSQFIEDKDYKVNINTYRLWRYINEIKSGHKINEVYLNKLERVLSIYLKDEDVREIVGFIQERGNYKKENNYYLIRNKEILNIYI